MELGEALSELNRGKAKMGTRGGEGLIWPESLYLTKLFFAVCLCIFASVYIYLLRYPSLVMGKGSGEVKC
jgi:hypothetical protein